MAFEVKSQMCKASAGERDNKRFADDSEAKKQPNKMARLSLRKGKARNT